ncbi:MAG: 50S ribosomal protein L35ae [Candidatus Aenigmarchaeota archaeon]|nr:50S ribosomal protein L35ae [Candidatus Aenigmarchaeota archaeon]
MLMAEEGTKANKARKAAPKAGKGQPKPAKAEAVKPEAGAPAADSRVAIILNYRGGRKTRRMNQMLIEVEAADSRTKASAYIGRRVVWKTPSGRLIYGRITHPHGSRGVLRARFAKGLPGEALGKKARVA